MIRVTALTQTCLCSPSQWEGWTLDGRNVYIRYRWGTLTVDIANCPGVHALEDGERIIDAMIGESEWDGYLALDDLKTATHDVLVIE